MEERRGEWRRARGEWRRGGMEERRGEVSKARRCEFRRGVVSGGEEGVSGREEG